MASPLRRAVTTAEIVFKYMRVSETTKWLIDHNCREPITGCDDIGHPKEALIKEFPYWDWSQVPENFWWYIPPDLPASSNLEEHRKKYLENPWHEPIKEAVYRVRSFERHLADCGYRKVAVVAHGDFIEALCGIPRLGNCGKAILQLDPVVPKEIYPEIQ